MSLPLLKCCNNLEKDKRDIIPSEYFEMKKATEKEKVEKSIFNPFTRFSQAIVQCNRCTRNYLLFQISTQA